MKKTCYTNILKKSFTLVELSVVLLVLSILTGTLLVGRKIVDRANIQRVIFEIDKYKTEFYQFSDTYGVLPGNVDENTCMKYSEFYSAQTLNDKKNNTAIVIGQYCNTKTIKGYNTLQIMATEYNWGSFLNAMKFMKTSGLIDNVYLDITGPDYAINETIDNQGNKIISGTDFPGNTENAQGPLQNPNQQYISYDNIKKTQATTSFDKEGAITYAGVSFDKNTSLEDRKNYANFIRGSNALGDNKKHEFSNAGYSNTIDDKNFIVFYRNVSSVANGTYGTHSTSTGLITADNMNQLDIKIDDGRPGTGKVLAMKNGYAHSISDNTEIKKVCYNQLEEKVDESYYNNNKDTKYGCNFIYVL